MNKGRDVPSDARVVFAAFVVRGTDNKLSLFYSGDIVRQVLKWDASDVRKEHFVMDTHIAIRRPRVIYVQNEQHVPLIGYPDGIYLPSGRFVALKQDARREIPVGGVHIGPEDYKPL